MNSRAYERPVHTAGSSSGQPTSTSPAMTTDPRPLKQPSRAVPTHSRASSPRHRSGFALQSGMELSLVTLGALARRAVFSAFLGTLALGSLASRAQAAGMFVTPHGARALGRGGALVAGADDLN